MIKREQIIMTELYGQRFTAMEMISWLKSEKKSLKFKELKNISGNSIFLREDIYNINLIESLYERYRKIRESYSNLIINLYYLGNNKNIIFFVGFDHLDEDLLEELNLSSKIFDSNIYTQIDRKLCKIRKVTNHRGIEFNMGRITMGYDAYSDEADGVTVEQQIKNLNDRSTRERLLSFLREKTDFTNERAANYYRESEKAFKKNRFWIRIWPSKTDLMKMAKTDISIRERYRTVEPYINPENHVVDISLMSQEEIDKIYLGDRENNKMFVVMNENLIYKD